MQASLVNIKDVVVSLNCPVELTPLFNAVTLSCGHKVNRGAAERIYGIMLEAGVCEQENKKCILCKENVFGYYQDVIMRKVVRKLYHPARIHKNQFLGFITCPKSRKILVEAITCLPCCHKFDESIAKVLYPQRAQNTCFVCQTPIHLIVKDHAIRYIAASFQTDQDWERLTSTLATNPEIKEEFKSSLKEMDVVTLRSSDVIKIPANTHLRIVHIAKNILEESLQDPYGFDNLRHLFNQVLLISGKTLKDLKSYGDARILEYDPDPPTSRLEIICDGETEFYFAHEDIHITVPSLKNRMIVQRQRCWHLRDTHLAPYISRPATVMLAPSINS